MPYEVICLVHAVEHGPYEKAYLVLGGSGWKRKLKQFYFDGGLNDYIETANQIEILSLEDFVTKTNQGKL